MLELQQPDQYTYPLTKWFNNDLIHPRPTPINVYVKNSTQVVPVRLSFTNMHGNRVSIKNTEIAFMRGLGLKI